VAQAQLTQGGLEPGTAHPDCEHPLLTRLRRPAAAVHHPQERRLDPRHPVHAERRDERAGGQGGVGDLVAVCLVDDDRFGVEYRAHLPRGRGHWRIHATSASDITLAHSNSSTPDVTVSASQVPVSLGMAMW
jgi:hypothetical protein